MEKVFLISGKSGAEKLSDVFISTIDSEKDELVGVLKTIDWQTTNVEDLRKTLYQAGISTYYADEAL
jgi:hypothetical protein